MNVVDKVWLPALRTVPEAGVYTNVPGTDAVAFSCVLLKGVPYVIAEGVAHVIVGVACWTVTLNVEVACVVPPLSSFTVQVPDEVGWNVLCAFPLLLLELGLVV